jgi:hypothetical protein
VQKPFALSTVSSETIGYSELGRPLAVTYHGRRNLSQNQKVRVFILAGQHGDERYGRKVVTKLIHILDNYCPIEFELLQVAILQDANPDGSFMKSRTNSSGIDLNRDHLFLAAIETKAIHSFVKDWRPHLIIDVHNYPSKRKHLLEKDLVLHHDVFLDTPTNPGVFLNYHMGQNILHQFLYEIKSKLQSGGFSCERYCLIKPSGRIRHSTPDVIDARNFLALRFNAMTVLLEGRAPTREDGKGQRGQLLSAQLRALLSILLWTVQNRSYLHSIAEFIPHAGDKVPTLLRYASPSQLLEMSFKSARSNDVKVLHLPNYTPLVEVVKYVDLPYAYAIPKENKRLLDLLYLHGFRSMPVGDLLADRIIQSYFVHSVKYSKKGRRFPMKFGAITVETDRSVTLSDQYEIFPTSQLGGHCLAILLEPTSKYGLRRSMNFGLSTLSDGYYQILRIL